jgi:hypothetical protein
VLLIAWRADALGVGEGLLFGKFARGLLQEEKSQRIRVGDAAPLNVKEILSPEVPDAGT